MHIVTMPTSFHKTNLPVDTRHKVTLYTRHVFFAHLPFQTHDPTQPTKNTNFRPIPDPTQPNQRVNPTHGQLCDKPRDTFMQYAMLWLIP